MLSTAGFRRPAFDLERFVCLSFALVLEASDFEIMQICTFFARTGRCKHGASCRFSHDLSDTDRVQEALDRDRASRGQLCSHYERHGVCNYGNKCRFLHVREGDLLNQTATSVTDPVALFTVLAKRKMRHCTTKQIQQFVKVAQQSLIGDTGIQSPVLEIMGSMDGVEILQNLFGSPKTFIVDDTASTSEVSLLHGFQFFLELATSPYVLNAPLQQHVNPFLLALGRSFEWEQLEGVLNELLSRECPPTSQPSSATNQTGASQHDDWIKLLRPLLSFWVELMRRFDTAFLKEMMSMHPVLLKVKAITRIDSITGRQHRQFVQEFHELTNCIAQKYGKRELQIEIGKRVESLCRSKNSESRKMTVMYADPPGEYRHLGPRHDNDKSDISLISVAPTEDEVLCNIPPYLPPKSVSITIACSGDIWCRAGTVVHLPIGSIVAHRDLHFRLLRHNLVSDIQTAVQYFIERGGIHSLEHQDRKEAQVAEGKDFREISMDMYRHVTVSAMDASKSSGVYYVLEFDEPEFLKNASEAARLNFWRKTKRLGHGSLVCLLWHRARHERPTIVFGAICERNENDLATSRPSLGIRSFPQSYNARLMSLLVFEGNEISETVMLQSGPSFFAFEPVLNALKTAPIPLSHIITQPPVTDSVDASLSPFSPNQATDGVESNVGLPLYAEQGGTFDLSFLSKDPSQEINSLKNVNASLPYNFPLEELIEHTTFDRCQAEALKVALTQEVALIQGPPGTGKTFVGIRIVQALLSYKTLELDELSLFSRDRHALGPILCICYTNHALDQFLVGLIESGIEDVVRVGGNIKNPKLERYNLRNHENKPSLGTTGYQLKYEEMPILEQEIGLVKRRSATKRHGIVNWLPVKNIVNETCPYFYQEVMVSEYLDDGPSWTINVTKEENRRWQYWCSYHLHENRLHSLHQPEVDELLNLYDFWDITCEEFQALYDFWTNTAFDNATSMIDELIDQYEDLVTRYSELEMKSNLYCLKRASVVGMTTTYVAKHQKLLAGLMPKVVILEEAAEVLEAHVLSCLSADTQQLIMIGDHQQLRPKVDSWMLQAESGSGFDLDVSLFERLITQKNVHHVTLQSQRRMRPQFSRLIRSTVYPNLQDHPSVSAFPESVPGMESTLFFFDHDHPEGGMQDAKSKTNDFEARVVVQLALYLMKQDCFAAGQLLSLRKYMKQINLAIRLNAKDEELLADYIEDSNNPQ